MKILKNFWRNLTVICRKIQNNQDSANNFHLAVKDKKPASKILRVWTRKDQNFENF